MASSCSPCPKTNTDAQAEPNRDLISELGKGLGGAPSGVQLAARDRGTTLNVRNAQDRACAGVGKRRIVRVGKRRQTGGRSNDPAQEAESGGSDDGKDAPECPLYASIPYTLPRQYSPGRGKDGRRVPRHKHGQKSRGKSLWALRGPEDTSEPDGGAGMDEANGTPANTRACDGLRMHASAAGRQPCITMVCLMPRPDRHLDAICPHGKHGRRHEACQESSNFCLFEN